MADSHSTQEHQTQTFVHHKMFGYENFQGTKEEIQAAGFGIGRLFPGEPGANKQKLSLGKCNGFASASIKKKWAFDRNTGLRIDTGLFEVTAYYIDREWPSSRTENTVFAPGVMRHEELRHDVYIGSPDALIDAGLVKPEQLPGNANTGKGRTTFLPDGTRVKQGGCGACNTAGSKTVKKLGSLIAVEINVEETVNEKRRAAWKIRSDEVELQYQRALAERHASVVASIRAQKPKDRSHLRLVWSA